MKIPPFATTLLAIGFGILGLSLILLISRKEGRMVHCTTYCPIGTIVNLGRYVNPFRLTIDQNSCTECMACTTKCKYNALNRADILDGKPGLTCTLCGDCLSSCHAGSLQYRFPGLSNQGARTLYLLISISLHAATMALARI
jgi:polyferredoxin